MKHDHERVVTQGDLKPLRNFCAPNGTRSHSWIVDIGRDAFGIYINGDNILSGYALTPNN